MCICIRGDSVYLHTTYEQYYCNVVLKPYYSSLLTFVCALFLVLEIIMRVSVMIYNFLMCVSEYKYDFVGVDITEKILCDFKFDNNFIFAKL